MSALLDRRPIARVARGRSGGAVVAGAPTVVVPRRSQGQSSNPKIMHLRNDAFFFFSSFGREEALATSGRGQGKGLCAPNRRSNSDAPTLTLLSRFPPRSHPP